MNQEDILKMAREAELSRDQFGVWLAMAEDLERFAALVAAKAAQDEREACAFICDDGLNSIWEYHDEVVKQTGRNVCSNLAASIRARGQ